MKAVKTKERNVERKIWRVQTAHLHNAARALSSPSRCFQLSRQIFISITLILWQKKQIECGLAWSVLLSTTIRVITVVKMLWTREVQPSKSWINWATSQSARFALVSNYVSSIHPWANSRCRISQSERALCFSYVIMFLGLNKIHFKILFDVIVTAISLNS